VEDLPAGAVCRGGAVGVEDQLPAPAVDAHVVVELAQQHAVADAGLAAVLLVPQVVHVAIDGGPAAARPGAAPVAQQHRAADVGGDAVGVADVQRQAGGVPGGFQQAGAQDRGQPGGAGDQVDGEPGHRVPQRGVRLGGQRRGPLAPCAAGVPVAPGANVAVFAAGAAGVLPVTVAGPWDAAAAAFAVAGVGAAVVSVATVAGAAHGVAGPVTAADRGQDQRDHRVHYGHVRPPRDDRDDQRVAGGRLRVLAGQVAVLA